MLLSGVRNSCDMLARNSDLYFDVRASSLAFSSNARRACSISWFLRSTSTLRSASCCAFWPSWSLVCCNSLCCVCNSPASCCDCLSNASVCIVASMLFSTIPMLPVSCSKKATCKSVNSATVASSITALTWFSNKNRQHDHTPRHDLEQCRSDRNGMRRHLRDQHAAPVGRALADQVPRQTSGAEGWPVAPSSA